jgi:YfiH family protein
MKNINAVLTKHSTDGIAWYSFKALDDLGFLANWITTRHGGTVPLGFDLASSGENRKMASRVLTGGREIFLPKQEHGTVAHLLTNSNEPVCAADAVIMTKPYIPAGVLTADCIPIILADLIAKRAAIIHAGRLGVFEDIIGQTIIRMGFGNEILACIGPSIHKCCYQVQEDIFNPRHELFKKYFISGMLDIAGAAADQLLEAGVKPANIHDCGLCTSCNVETFYSHRKEKGKAGRFMTGIMLLQ